MLKHSCLFAPIHSIVTTRDGSHTVLLHATGEHYHSQFGALTESLYVFEMQGLINFREYKVLNLLEVGFGTGLNAALAFRWAVENQVEVHYTGLEPFPLPLELIHNLNYGNFKEVGVYYHLIQQHYSQLIDGLTVPVDSSHCEVVRKRLLDFETNQRFDLVFYDAFSPSTQEDMWSEEAVRKIVSLMEEGGVLVTYCIRAYIRRAFEALGCKAEKLPGPPGKREMLRITKL